MLRLWELFLLNNRRCFQLSPSYFFGHENREKTQNEKKRGRQRGERKTGTNGIQKERTEEERQMRIYRAERSHRKDFAIEKDREE